MSIEAEYKRRLRTPSDINQLLPVLRRYAEAAQSIIEFGLRSGNSATAFLAARPETFTTYDINESCRSTFQYLARLAYPETTFRFINADSLRIVIPSCDLLFIDSFHTYRQLSAELRLHAQNAMRFIILHDSETFGLLGEDRRAPGLKRAILDFLARDRVWRVLEHYRHSNGLTVLQRKT
jgi:hypothetical protein